MQKSLVERKQTSLKVAVDKSHNTLIESAKQQVEAELTVAKKQYQQRRMKVGNQKKCLLPKKR